MKVLVDTSVWSLVLRKMKKNPIDESITRELQELICELRVVVIGPIRQEILSGISDKSKFELLKRHLSYFEDELLSSEYFIKAAEFSNICRSKGIQGSHTDFLICSFAEMNKYSIFSLDKDFELYSKYINLCLHSIRPELE